MNPSNVVNGLKGTYPARLVDHLLETYTEVKTNLYLGRLRPNEIEGGRFAEAVFRLLEFETTGTFTAIGQHIDSEKIIQQLARLPTRSYNESLRLHIPRTLRLIYDI